MAEYESDFNTVDRVTLDVAREVLRDVPGGVATFEPVIRYHAFGDTSIDFTVVLRDKDIADQDRLKHEFITRLVRCYQRVGITRSSIPVARPEIGA